MKNKKVVILIALIIILIITIIIVFKPREINNKTELKSILDLKEYEELKLDKIKVASIIRLTEGGRTEERFQEKDEIEKIFNRVSKIKIIEETDQSCVDNTTIFEFIMDDNQIIVVEIECDWIVLKDKRFLIKTS